jgi:hypothetical protein
VKKPSSLANASPAALARAIAILRAEGDHDAADFLQSHLPPAHGPLPHWDDSLQQQPGQPQANGGAQQPLSPNGDEGAGEGPFPDAGSLSEHGAPHPPNNHSEGSLPPKMTKGFDPNEPRDAHGEWTDEGAGGNSFTVKLYRASDDDVILDVASFSTSRAAAESYLDNPGFGGAHLWKTNAKINRDEFLDLYDLSHDEALDEIHKLTGLGDPGAIGIDEWVPRISTKLEKAGIRWVRVRESYPSDTETYIYLGGSDDPDMTRIDKAYEWTHNPLTPSFPLTDTTAPDKPAPETEHKFGCVYLPVPEPVRGRVLALGKMIPDVDLAESGREHEPHATILHGLHEHVPHADVFEVLSHFRPVRLRLGKVSVFQHPECDVLKVEVESDQIRRLNNALRRLPYTSKWSEYRPHITIASLKPGLGQIYAARFGDLGAKCRCASAVYSTPDGEKHIYPLGRLIRIEKAPMSYLNAGTGGALVGPPAAGRKKRIRLKRNRSALAQLCKAALAEVGDYTDSFFLTKPIPTDPEEFVFGEKAHNPQQRGLWDESEHSRESSAHDNKKPGEFAPKAQGKPAAPPAQESPPKKA